MKRFFLVDEEEDDYMPDTGGVLITMTSGSSLVLSHVGRLFRRAPPESVFDIADMYIEVFPLY
ncbi:hypothetical protein ACFL4Q_03230 [candidate division KSB1 bacterium]